MAELFKRSEIDPTRAARALRNTGFDPKRHPRKPKGIKGGGRFAKPRTSATQLRLEN